MVGGVIGVALFIILVAVLVWRKRRFQQLQKNQSGLPLKDGVLSPPVSFLLFGIGGVSELLTFWDRGEGSELCEVHGSVMILSDDMYYFSLLVTQSETSSSLLEDSEIWE